MHPQAREQMSRPTFSARPTDQSIAKLPSACRRGTCGSPLGSWQPIEQQCCTVPIFTCVGFKSHTHAAVCMQTRYHMLSRLLCSHHLCCFAAAQQHAMVLATHAMNQQHPSRAPWQQSSKVQHTYTTPHTLSGVQHTNEATDTH